MASQALHLTFLLESNTSLSNFVQLKFLPLPLSSNNLGSNLTYGPYINLKYSCFLSLFCCIDTLLLLTTTFYSFSIFKQYDLLYSFNLDRWEIELLLLSIAIINEIYLLLMLVLLWEGLLLLLYIFDIE